MLKVNQPKGFRAGMGSSVRRTWVLPLLQTNHSFVLSLLLTKPHCQPVLLGSLFRVSKATPHQRTGLRQAHASPRHRAERRRCDAGAPSHTRLSSLQSPQVAPTCHHLGLGLLFSDPSYRGPPTILSESENYKAVIYAFTGILFFRSKGIYETQGQ